LLKRANLNHHISDMNTAMIQNRWNNASPFVRKQQQPLLEPAKPTASIPKRSSDPNLAAAAVTLTAHSSQDHYQAMIKEGKGISTSSASLPRMPQRSSAPSLQYYSQKMEKANNARWSPTPPPSASSNALLALRLLQRSKLTTTKTTCTTSADDIGQSHCTCPTVSSKDRLSFSNQSERLPRSRLVQRSSAPNLSLLGSTSETMATTTHTNTMNAQWLTSSTSASALVALPLAGSSKTNHTTGTANNNLSRVASKDRLSYSNQSERLPRSRLQRSSAPNLLQTQRLVSLSRQISNTNVAAAAANCDDYTASNANATWSSPAVGVDMKSIPSATPTTNNSRWHSPATVASGIAALKTKTRCSSTKQKMPLRKASLDDAFPAVGTRTSVPPTAREPPHYEGGEDLDASTDAAGVRYPVIQIRRTASLVSECSEITMPATHC